MQLSPSAAVSDEIIVLSDPASSRAESIRLLRTQIIAQHVDAGRRAFAVAAATDGAGASYISANLAVALSQVGIKTLLVDANLRNPRLDGIFGIDPNGPGLTTYLGMQANRPERVVYSNVLANLSVVPAGPPVARPQELLSGARFRTGIDILLRQYDVAIFDTPSSNENADALTVAGALGYALIVARRDHAYVKDIQVLSEQLGAARATVIGAVLNEFA
jgi:capsular exopolysaccharide synthesis family protein